MMKAFTMNEMENIFEIGRAIQYAVDFEDGCVIQDSKETFLFALGLALEFEKEHPDSDDYYTEIDNFITGRILKELKTENSMK